MSNLLYFYLGFSTAGYMVLVILLYKFLGLMKDFYHLLKDELNKL